MRDYFPEFRRGTILLLTAIALASAPWLAEAATQALCVNPGGTAGCESTISAAVALISASRATITVAGGTYIDNVSINTGQTPKKLTLTITGTAGAGSTTIKGNSVGAVFQIGSNVAVGLNTVTIDGLTIENGLAMQSPNSLGGGISAYGATLTVKNCVVTNNQATLGAGVYDVDANVTITNSSITNNSGQGMGSSGGGVYVNGKGKRKLSISGSIIDSNSAAFGGGAFISRVLGSLTGTIKNSTISNNSSFATSEGGGLFVQFAKLTITDSTISGNQATGTTGQGGGICTFVGDLTLNNVTVANNSATSNGGGILANINDKKFAVSNTIIADNVAPGGPDCAGDLLSNDYNLIGNPADCTLTGKKTKHNLTGDPMLGPLQNNGGTTDTQALLPASPAAGKGNPATPNGGVRHCFPQDQIGTPRRRGQCDIGAYQTP